MGAHFKRLTSLFTVVLCVLSISILPSTFMYVIFRGSLHVAPSHRQFGIRRSSSSIHSGTIDTSRISAKPVSVSDEIEKRQPSNQVNDANGACAKRRRAKSFLMIFMGHSGSSAIASELSRHPSVYMERREMLERRETIENSTLALLETRAFFKRGLALNMTPGFKMRPAHVMRNIAAWQSLAAEFDTRVIWQYRRNSIKKAVGEYSVQVYKDRSARMGLHRRDKGNRCAMGAGCAFAINDLPVFRSILIDIARTDVSIEQGVRAINADRGCVHELLYEDYLYERERTIGDLQRFLGLERIATQSLFTKATKDNMCDVVTNWQEICENFFQCPQWRPLFNSDRNNCSCHTLATHPTYCK